MQACFKTLPFHVATTDGRNFTLLTDVLYVAADGRAYRLPAGATSDGASTPRELWPLIPPFGKYWPAAYLHDCAYRNTLLVPAAAPGAPWQPAALPKPQCDALLREAMQSLGCDTFETDTIYEGVALAGQPSFAQDRAAALAIHPPQYCYGGRADETQIFRNGNG